MIWEELLKGIIIFFSVTLSSFIVILIINSVFKFIGSMNNQDTIRSKKDIPKRVREIRKKGLEGKTLRNLN